MWSDRSYLASGLALSIRVTRTRGTMMSEERLKNLSRRRAREGEECR